MSRHRRAACWHIAGSLIVALASSGCATGERAQPLLPPAEQADRVEAVPEVGDDDVPSATAPVEHDDGDADGDRETLVDDALEEDEGMLDVVSDFVERSHAGATDHFGGFMYQLDDFFAGDLQSDEPNGSYIRLRFDAAKPALDSFELDPSIKLRVVLPRAEQRFRLMLSTGDEVDDNDREQTRVTALSSSDESVSLALRFVRRAKDSGRIDYDVGARQRRGSLQVYGRINAEYRDELDERWTVRAGNKYYYYSKSGFDDRLSFDLTRTLGDTKGRFLRIASTADWRKGQRGAKFGQSVGVYADLNERSALAIEAFGVYDTSLNGEQRHRYRGHEFRVRYRRNIWRPWLFYEFWPAIAWPAEYGYRRVWNGLLRLEITIGVKPLEFPSSGDGNEGAGPVDAAKGT